uniref:Uncharacterized protein n=1 Tax=Megaselia scalaris TaxID=36166 RepID=T1H079_MEGSC
MSYACLKIDEEVLLIDMVILDIFIEYRHEYSLRKLHITYLSNKRNTSFCVSMVEYSSTIVLKKVMIMDRDIWGKTPKIFCHNINGYMFIIRKKGNSIR